MVSFLLMFQRCSDFESLLVEALGTWKLSQVSEIRTIPKGFREEEGGGGAAAAWLTKFVMRTEFQNVNLRVMCHTGFNNRSSSTESVAKLPISLLCCAFRSTSKESEHPLNLKSPMEDEISMWRHFKSVHNEQAGEFRFKTHSWESLRKHPI